MLGGNVRTGMGEGQAERHSAHLAGAETVEVRQSSQRTRPDRR